MLRTEIKKLEKQVKELRALAMFAAASAGISQIILTSLVKGMSPENQEKSHQKALKYLNQHPNSVEKLMVSTGIPQQEAESLLSLFGKPLVDSFF